MCRKCYFIFMFLYPVLISNAFQGYFKCHSQQKGGRGLCFWYCPSVHLCIFLCAQYLKDKQRFHQDTNIVLLNMEGLRSRLLEGQRSRLLEGKYYYTDAPTSTRVGVTYRFNEKCNHVEMKNVKK